jgi:hypothetical protein
VAEGGEGSPVICLLLASPCFAHPWKIGQGSEGCCQSEFNEKIAELGLEGTYAYVPTKRTKAEWRII